MRETKYPLGKHTIFFNLSTKLYNILEEDRAKVEMNRTEYLALLIENASKINEIKELQKQLEECRASKTIELEDLYEILKAKKITASSLPESEIIDYLKTRYQVNENEFVEFIKNKKPQLIVKDKYPEYKQAYFDLLNLEITKQYYEIRKQLDDPSLTSDARAEFDKKCFELWKSISVLLPEGILRSKAFLDRAISEVSA